MIRIPAPPIPKMETVEVQRCLDINGVETCIPRESPYRFITIKPVLINNERQRFFIEQLLANPAIERPEDPLEDAMEPEAKQG